MLKKTSRNSNHHPQPHRIHYDRHPCQEAQMLLSEPNNTTHNHPDNLTYILLNIPRSNPLPSLSLIYGLL